MRDKKYMSMLGMARRAGKLSMGHDMVEKAIKSKKAKLLIYSSDSSKRLEDEFKLTIERFCPNLETKRIDETINDIHVGLGYKAGVITIDDENFSRRILELINQEENIYGNKD